MNKYLSNLIDTGIMISGRITFDNGYAVFKRLSKEEAESLPEEGRAYATNTMGRAVFMLGNDGKIINFKGVDSHFENSEMGLIDKVGALPIDYTKDGQSYRDSYYPLNLVLYLDQNGQPRADIRIRGASPLEDLEIEAEINSRMKRNEIKLPEIKQVKEFSEEFLKRYNLPLYIGGSFDEFDSDYTDEDLARKSYLKDIMGERYLELPLEGKRPETVAEYLNRIGVKEDPRVQEFLRANNVSIEHFADYVDKDYSRGQRYGQGIREIESPFRIADFEILLGDINNLPAIEAMVGFTESMHPDRVPFENYFAIQLGRNLGNMMNNGWECENFSHRQDYSITGEMCDDSYVYVPKEIEKLDDLEFLGNKELRDATDEETKKIAKDKVFKAKYGKINYRMKFFTQIYLLSSNIKVLQDEMRMRGKSNEEVDSVLSDFLDSFKQTVDLEKASMKISDRPDTAKKALEILARTPKNMAKLLAFEPSGPDKSDLKDEVLRTQKPFNAFFDEVSMGLVKRFDLDRTFINITHRDVQGVNPYKDFSDEENR